MLIVDIKTNSHNLYKPSISLQADKMMPPPKYAPIKKRRSRRATDFVSSRSNNQQQQQQSPQTASQPSTPTLLGKSATTGRRPASVSALTTGGLLAQTLSSGISTGSIQKDHRQQHQNDSDSDGACGFDSAWRGSAWIWPGKEASVLGNYMSSWEEYDSFASRLQYSVSINKFSFDAKLFLSKETYYSSDKNFLEARELYSE